MNAPTMTVARYLIQRLSQLGAEHLFAVPGDYAGDFLLAVDQDGAVQRVGTCNELEAGYAADAYARLRGIGAVSVTYGVGAFSLLNAVAGSFVERLPVVAIVGSPSTTQRRIERGEGVLYHHSTGRLGVDRSVFAPVTVVAEVIRAPECAPAQIDEALTAAITWKRPVYLEVLENVWNQPCTEPAGALSPRPLPVDTGALEEAVAETVARVTTARKPVIWSGVEIARFGLQDELEQLIAASALPFATDLLGKATLSENHAGFVGVYDGAPAGKTLRDLVEQSDCVLALGTIVNDDALDLVDKDYARMILAVDNTLRIGYHLYAGIPLQAFLAGMRKQLQERSFASPASAADFAPVAYPETAGLPPNGQITFESFFERMKRFVDESMVLMADTCISLYCAADLRVAREKGWVSQSTWGSIGYTMGGALGVGCAEPDRRPVVWVGDGGFQMICQALSTMVREKQSPIVFVMNNGIYGIEQALVNLKFYTEGQPAARFNILPRWDYARLTEAFGGWGCTVETQEELEAALAQAKTNTNSPSLIEVRLPERDLPPQVKRLAEDPG